MIGLDPHVQASASPIKLIKSLFIHRDLIAELTTRDILGRYKGSFIGIGWSLVHPLILLSAYTLVFSQIFQVRWSPVAGNVSLYEFALILFVGIILLGLFNEVMQRAPGLVIANANYVKRVVFPIEVLPVVSVGTALFHAAISFGVLIMASTFIQGTLHWTTLFLPLILLPYMLWILGVAWFLSSFGVFVRDIGQSVGAISTLLMFLSPVFYPVSAVPESFRALMMANPLTFVIEQSRGLLLWGETPDFYQLAWYSLAAAIFCWLGYAWFQKTRKGFADVL